MILLRWHSALQGSGRDKLSAGFKPSLSSPWHSGVNKGLLSLPFGCRLFEICCKTDMGASQRAGFEGQPEYLKKRIRQVGRALGHKARDRPKKEIQRPNLQTGRRYWKGKHLEYIQENIFRRGCKANLKLFKGVSSPLSAERQTICPDRKCG